MVIGANYVATIGVDKVGDFGYQAALIRTINKKGGGWMHNHGAQIF
jgi:hypothetical protein